MKYIQRSFRLDMSQRRSDGKCQYRQLYQRTGGRGWTPAVCTVPILEIRRKARKVPYNIYGATSITTNF
jgi:hypothetical protein